MPIVEANRLRMNYEWHGAELKPVVVLINGLLTDMGSWAGHLPYLTGQFRVLTYDCRGQGATDKPDHGPYTAAMHAEDLEHLLDVLGVQRCALVGVSSGGCIALQFAARHPDRLTALVAANAYAFADQALCVKLNGWLAGMAAGGGPLRFDVATPWVWGATFLNNNYEALKPFREKGSTLPEHVVRHLIAGAMQQDVLESLCEVTCPTLLLTGDEDVLTPVSYSRTIQERIRGAALITMEKAGHCMFLEQVGPFAQHVASFLKEEVGGAHV